MSQRSRTKIQRSLRKKGFKETEARKHTSYKYVTLDGASSDIMTILSRGTGYKEIGNGLLSDMAKQCHLGKEDFLRLIDCVMEQKEYEQHLIKEKKIPPKQSRRPSR